MDIDIAIEKTQSPRKRPAPGTYGFGKHFSDHMFVLDYTEVTGWHSPRIVPYQALRLDPGAAVLHYGQALFEGMKAFRGDDGVIRLFRPEMNWKRMKAGTERLCMKAPPLEIFMEGLLRFVQIEKDWIPSEPGTALYLRPTLIGSEAFLGVRPSEQYIFYVIGSPVGGFYGENVETVKIWVETTYSRCAPGGIGAVKAGGNYASSLLAAREAKARGYAQVLWLDAANHNLAEEVGTMNVFFVVGGKVVTPPLSGTILPGVMRDSAIQMLSSMGVEVEQRSISIEEIRAAHESGQLTEVFGTGTAASVSPVGLLGFPDRQLTIGDGKPGKIARELYKNITDIQYGRRPDDMGWTVEVPALKSVQTAESGPTAV
ncbi:MAG: branched-chain amino acid aminotransferase [Bdellovibrionota bacterium]